MRLRLQLRLQRLPPPSAVNGGSNRRRRIRIRVLYGDAGRPAVFTGSGFCSRALAAGDNPLPKPRGTEAPGVFGNYSRGFLKGLPSGKPRERFKKRSRKEILTAFSPERPSLRQGRLFLRAGVRISFLSLSFGRRCTAWAGRCISGRYVQPPGPGAASLEGMLTA